MTEMLRLLSERELELGQARLTPAALAGLVRLVDAKTINMPTAKEVFALLFEQGGDPEVIVRERGLAQVSETSALEALVREAVAGNPKSVTDFKAGREAALKFLVGQVMKASRGKANPQMVQDLLRKQLG